MFLKDRIRVILFKLLALRYIYSKKSLMVFCKIYDVCDNAIDSLREVRFGISLVKDIKNYHHH